MEYHKDQFAFVDRMEYLRAPLAVQAAHQWLIRYCARRETAGTIEGCGGWTDREWAIATNGQLRRRDVIAVSDAGLAAWVKAIGRDSADLLVSGYDLVGERDCLRERQRLREYRNAKKGPAGATVATEVIHMPGAASRTPSETGTRTGTVHVREHVRDADQSSPVQTSPDQTSPHQTSPHQTSPHTPPNPPQAGGAVGVASGGDDFDARLTAALDQLGVASGPEANRRWVVQAQRNPYASTEDQLLAVIRYAVRRGREVLGDRTPAGKPTVNHASDVREYFTGWRPKQAAAP